MPTPWGWAVRYPYTINELRGQITPGNAPKSCPQEFYVIFLKQYNGSIFCMYRPRRFVQPFCKQSKKSHCCSTRDANFPTVLSIGLFGTHVTTAFFLWYLSLPGMRHQGSGHRLAVEQEKSSNSVLYMGSWNGWTDETWSKDDGLLTTGVLELRFPMVSSYGSTSMLDSIVCEVRTQL